MLAPAKSISVRYDALPMLETLDPRRLARRHISPWAALRWAITRRPARWPRWVERPPGETPPERVEEGLRYAVLNHSTVLLQLHGLNVLTDPIFSRRCSPLPFVGPQRVCAPGVPFEQLPPIDAVLVSHNHYDHLDLATLGRLWLRDRPRFFVATGDGATLRRRGIADVLEMRWWERVALGRDVELELVPAQHFSGRGVTDRNRSLWGGFVLESELGRVYFCGDTGYGPFVAELAKRFAPLSLAFLPIGAYLPRWFMGPVHVDPQQAVRMHRELRSRRSVAIHFGTFQLTDEAIDEPERELARARHEQDVLENAFEVPVFGHGGWL